MNAIWSNTKKLTQQSGYAKKVKRIKPSGKYQIYKEFIEKCKKLEWEVPSHMSEYVTKYNFS